MKSHFITLLLALSALNAMADEVPAMKIAKNDGTALCVDIDKIQNIKFRDGQMVVARTDGDALEVSLSSIKCITFDDVETAIQAIASEAKDVVIYDVQGRRIYSGNKEGVPQLHGTFVVNGHKVIIK